VRDGQRDQRHRDADPGGVGPMTRAMLLSNVVLAAEQAVGTEVLSA
jgi:methylenetetrahydrofolate dehydrogenase (NADP+)/methenyltetrahydrofolate cyclohydrolase